MSLNQKIKNMTLFYVNVGTYMCEPIHQIQEYLSKEDTKDKLS